MEIERQFAGATTIAIVNSLTIDYQNASIFRGKMIDLINAGDTLLALDMRGVEFIDSRGLGCFISISKALGEKGRMCLFNVQDRVKAVFVMTRTEQLLPIFDNAAAAESYLLSPS